MIVYKITNQEQIILTTELEDWLFSLLPDVELRDIYYSSVSNSYTIRKNTKIIFNNDEDYIAFKLKFGL